MSPRNGAALMAHIGLLKTHLLAREIERDRPTTRPARRAGLDVEIATLRARIATEGGK